MRRAMTSVHPFCRHGLLTTAFLMSMSVEAVVAGDDKKAQSFHRRTLAISKVRKIPHARTQTLSGPKIRGLDPRGKSDSPAQPDHDRRMVAVGVGSGVEESQIDLMASDVGPLRKDLFGARSTQSVFADKTYKSLSGPASSTTSSAQNRPQYLYKTRSRVTAHLRGEGRVDGGVPRGGLVAPLREPLFTEIPTMSGAGYETGEAMNELMFLDRLEAMIQIERSRLLRRERHARHDSFGMYSGIDSMFSTTSPVMHGRQHMRPDSDHNSPIYETPCPQPRTRLDPIVTGKRQHHKCCLCFQEMETPCLFHSCGHALPFCEPCMDQGLIDLHHLRQCRVCGSHKSPLHPQQ